MHVNAGVRVAVAPVGDPGGVDEAEAVVDPLEGAATTVASQATCLVTARKSVLLAHLILPAVAALVPATTVARRDICPGNALTVEMVNPVARMTAAATIAEKVGTCLVTVQMVGLPAAATTRSVTSAVVQTTSRGTAPRLAVNVAMTAALAATTAMRLATSQEIALWRHKS